METGNTGQREIRNLAAGVIIWLVNSASLLLASALLPGVKFDSVLFAFVAALALSIATMFIEPVLFLLTLPINVSTFGLFTLVVNGFILYVISRIVTGFQLRGGFWSQLGWAVAAALIVSFFRMIVRSVLVRLRIIDKRG